MNMDPEEYAAQRLMDRWREGGGLLGVLVDELEARGIEGVVTAYSTGTVQITMKGKPTVIERALGSMVDGLIADHEEADDD